MELALRVEELEAEVRFLKGRNAVLEADRANLLVAASQRHEDFDGALEGAVALLSALQRSALPPACIGGSGCTGLLDLASHRPGCLYSRLLEAVERLRATPVPPA